MSKISYHFKDGNAVSIDFNEDDLEYDELKGKVAFCVLESLKVQNILDMVVFTSENNEVINLI